MKDSYKGLILILLAVIASVFVFYDEGRRWEMAFINHTPEIDDVANIQAQILAGLDPTTIAAPTAAGHRKNPQKKIQCLIGSIARNHPKSKYHGEHYVAVKQEGNTYIELPSMSVRLLKTTFNVQSATIVNNFPADVSENINYAVGSAKCSQIDLYLARIKQEI